MERIGLLGDMRVEQEQVELLNSALQGVSSPIGKDQVCLSVDALHACYSGLVANARACKKSRVCLMHASAYAFVVLYLNSSLLHYHWWTCGRGVSTKHLK